LIFIIFYDIINYKIKERKKINMEKKIFYNIPTQVKFQEWDGTVGYGIAYGNEIICGCCGYVIPLDEEVTILEELLWVPLKDEIKGDY
jgi:hypothetical protein